MKIGMPILFEFNSLKENIELAKELGFDFIELNLNFDYCRNELENNKEVLNTLQNSDLEFTLHFYDEADFASYDEVAKAYLKLLKKYLKLSKKINIKLLNVHLNVGPVVTISGVKNYMYDKEYDSYIKRLIKNLRKVEKECFKYKIELVLENTKMTDFIEKTYLDLNKENFAFNYDIGHDYTNKEKLKDLFNNTDFNLREFHFHDSTKTKDHLSLGEGEMNLKYYKEMIYDEYVLLELKSSGDLKKSINIFKEL